MRLRPVSFLLRIALVLAVTLTTVNLATLAYYHRGFALLALGIVAWRRMKRWRGSDGAYGTARSCDIRDLAAAGLLGDHGLILGDCGYIDPPSRLAGLRALFSRLPSHLAVRLFLAAFLGRRFLRNIPIRLPSHVHLGTFAPAGAGKGTSAVVPNLLSQRLPIITPDPKGENFKLTADFRRRKFGHTIYRLDPFNVCGPGGGGLNPMDFLPPATDPAFLDGCRDIANALVVRPAVEHDPHWNDRAEQVVTAMICFVAAVETDPAMRNLLTVRQIVASREVYLATVDSMRKRSGVVKLQGDSLTWLADKELNSVLSVVQRHTAWMDSPAVSACLKHSSFKAKELRGKQTTYLILPPERLVTLAPLMRCWLNTILRSLTRGEPSEKEPVLFLLDEVAHWGGKMQILEDALTLMRGFGIRCWLFFQSPGQLKEVFSDKAQVILDNLSTQQYFSINSYESAEEVSRSIGDISQSVASLNETTSTSMPIGSSMRDPGPGSRSTSSAVTYSEVARRWAKPEELMVLPKNYSLLRHMNLPIITPRLVPYYASPLFRWGGTGKSPGLGIVGSLAATAMLMIALVIARVVASVPPPAAGMAAPQPATYYDGSPVDPYAAPPRYRLTGQSPFPLPR